MPKMKQLSVSCENRPGTLSQIAKALGGVKVNILAFQVVSSGAMGSVQLVVDNVNKAKKALSGAGLSYTEEEVLHVQLTNMPGVLGDFAGKLAARNINIASGYGTTVKGSRKANVVLAVSDLDKAVRVR